MIFFGTPQDNNNRSEAHVLAVSRPENTQISTQLAEIWRKTNQQGKVKFMKAFQIQCNKENDVSLLRHNAESCHTNNIARDNAQTIRVKP